MHNNLKFRLRKLLDYTQHHGYLAVSCRDKIQKKHITYHWVFLLIENVKWSRTMQPSFLLEGASHDKYSGSIALSNFIAPLYFLPVSQSTTPGRNCNLCSWRTDTQPPWWIPHTKFLFYFLNFLVPSLFPVDSQKTSGTSTTPNPPWQKFVPEPVTLCLL